MARWNVAVLVGHEKGPERGALERGTFIGENDALTEGEYGLCGCRMTFLGIIRFNFFKTGSLWDLCGMA